MENQSPTRRQVIPQGWSLLGLQVLTAPLLLHWALRHFLSSVLCSKPINHSKLSWIPHGSGGKIAWPSMASQRLRMAFGPLSRSNAVYIHLLILLMSHLFYKIYKTRLRPCQTPPCPLVNSSGEGLLDLHGGEGYAYGSLSYNPSNLWASCIQLFF